jgi:hypothetical protein
VADEADRERALKRGGGAILSPEFSLGEERYQHEPAHDETPERIFERRWLRKRYRELFRQEIADTVADPAEVESELRFLAAVLTKK